MTINKEQDDYLQRLYHFNQELKRRQLKSPRDLVADGITRSTNISDKKTVAELTDKAMHGEAYTKEGSYDTFLFNIAESLETTRSGTSSQNEYFSWISDAHKIMDHMRDGRVTLDDLHEKNDFINMSWQRESELLVCLGLYEKSNNPLAKVKHDELIVKLQRLRQIRSALSNGTKNKADFRPLTPEEKRRLERHIQALKEMEECSSTKAYRNLRLENLGISHNNDVEFYRGYSFWTRMLEDQRRYDEVDEHEAEYESLRHLMRNFDEYLSQVKYKNDSIDNIKARIQSLSGRRSIAKDVTSFVRDKHLSFDVRRYRELLEEMQNS